MRDAAVARLARVVSVGRNAAWIAFEGSDELHFASLRKHQERLSLVPGDVVQAIPMEDEKVVIDRREPRTFALERRTAGGRTKTMAANVDGIAIVASFEAPPFPPAMVDELLAFAEIHDLTPRLLLTKADLAQAADVERILALYVRLGYMVLSINPRARVGLDAVDREFRGHRTLLIGQSGVGKSSLFRALGGPAVVGEVSAIGRGRQTTTTGRLHHFDDGFLIDSPGVSEFELHGQPWSEVAYGFIEFRPYLGKCRFSDCSHRAEPGCAIRAAIAAGDISPSRFESYTTITDRERA
jgi:ribosome biogenesis GTPase